MIDGTRTWARTIGRMGVQVTSEGLSDAIIRRARASRRSQALYDDVLANRWSMSDLAVRVAMGRQIREGRVRAVGAGGRVWFAWRDSEDLSPLLPRVLRSTSQATVRLTCTRMESAAAGRAGGRRSASPSCGPSPGSGPRWIRTASPVEGR